MVRNISETFQAQIDETLKNIEPSLENAFVKKMYSKNIYKSMIIFCNFLFLKSNIFYFSLLVLSNDFEI